MSMALNKMTSILWIMTLVLCYVCCAVGHSCITPDGAQGTCVGLDFCSYLVDMLRSNPTPASLKFVQDSTCEGADHYNVCCQLEPNSIPSLSSGGTVKQHCQLTAYPPEPNSQCCGIDASGGGNRIVGGSATAVEEYPWLALIEYTNNNRTYLLCGAVLISGRYVLTAGHCVAGPVLLVGTPSRVRLGEYDISNPGVDCVYVEGGAEDCTEGPVSVRIEKIIPHPNYNSESKRRRNDIALIRLAKTVQFTDFIRPICLPTVDFTTSQPEDVTLYAAGWGTVDDKETTSNIKLKVGLPYVSYQDCQSSYNVPGRQVKLWKGQVCAGGKRGKDSCKGDSGGPLIRETGRFSELVGIVSFGPKPCGIVNVKGVYTKVFHYLPWIRSQITT